jgi:hypothetical protein
MRALNDARYIQRLTKALDNGFGSSLACLFLQLSIRQNADARSHALHSFRGQAHATWRIVRV